MMIPELSDIVSDMVVIVVSTWLVTIFDNRANINKKEERILGGLEWERKYLKNQ